MIPEGQTPREVADLLKDIIQDKVVCDIGCGGGSFLDALSRYAKKCIGIEENQEWGQFTAERRPDFEVYIHNTFFHKLPEADVYYSWSKDSMGVYLKAKHEGTKGVFIFGHSERPSTKEFIQSLNPEKRTVGDFSVYITNL